MSLRSSPVAHQSPIRPALISSISPVETSPVGVSPLLHRREKRWSVMDLANIKNRWGTKISYRPVTTNSCILFYKFLTDEILKKLHPKEYFFRSTADKGENVSPTDVTRILRADINTTSNIVFAVFFCCNIFVVDFQLFSFFLLLQSLTLSTFKTFRRLHGAFAKPN